MLSLRKTLTGVVVAGLSAAAVISAVSVVGNGFTERATSRERIANLVTADILPPPMYLVELRLVLSMAVDGTMPIAQARQEYARLTREYQGRVAAYQTAPPYGLEKHLLGAQHTAGENFLKAAETVLNTVATGGHAQAVQALQAAHTIYLEHRAGVDATVQVASAFATDAAEQRRTAQQQTAIAQAGVLLLAAFLLIGLGRMALRSTFAATGGEPAEVARIANAVARGDLTTPVTVLPGDTTSVMASMARMCEQLAALLGSEREHLAQIVDATQAGTWELNLGKGEVFVSATFAEVLGYRTTAHVIANMDNDFVNLAHPDDRELLLRAQGDHLEGRTPLYEVELRLRHRLGRWVWVMLRGRTIARHTDGRGVTLAGIVLDISERKHAADRLQLAMEQAQAASRTKSQFLANMSHELRTPMNGILGMLNLLQSTPLDEQQQEYTATTAHSARALLAILNDILDFSKVDAGMMTLDPHPFAVEALLRDIATNLKAAAGDRGLTIRTEHDASILRPVLGDEMRLRQILMNLGGNALKFTELGAVVLRVRLLESSPEKGLLEFSVRDTGIGISSAEQDRIFGEFSQADASTTRRFGGTGLGLAISQRLVRLMDGELQVQSQVGEGSTFYFRISLPWAPLVAEPAVAVSTATPKAAAVRSQRLVGLRLLVVEDNAINQRVAMGLLTREGAHVTLASNGELGVAQVQGASEPFDVVLMDLQMPVMDGFAATKALRESWSKHRLPIIAMTANATESDRERCMAADMNDHVGKPFDLDHLVQVLLRCTGRMGMTAER